MISTEKLEQTTKTVKAILENTGGSLLGLEIKETEIITLTLFIPADKPDPKLVAWYERAYGVDLSQENKSES